MEIKKEVISKAKNYIPEAIVLTTGMATQLYTNHKIMTRNKEVLAKCYKAIGERYEEYKRKVIYEFTSNNWRKMHGLPMRRKKALKH